MRAYPGDFCHLRFALNMQVGFRWPQVYQRNSSASFQCGWRLYILSLLVGKVSFYRIETATQQGLSSLEAEQTKSGRVGSPSKQPTTPSAITAVTSTATNCETLIISVQSASQLRLNYKQIYFPSDNTRKQTTHCSHPHHSLLPQCTLTIHN